MPPLPDHSSAGPGWVCCSLSQALDAGDADKVTKGNLEQIKHIETLRPIAQERDVASLLMMTLTGGTDGVRWRTCGAGRRQLHRSPPNRWR